MCNRNDAHSSLFIVLFVDFWMRIGRTPMFFLYINANVLTKHHKNSDKTAVN